jgi:hypothetical protein
VEHSGDRVSLAIVTYTSSSSRQPICDVFLQHCEMYDYTQFSQETKVIETNEIRPWIEVGLCKERKPKRPNPETTETGNSRLISRITNNYIVDARSLAYHLDKYRKS